MAWAEVVFIQRGSEEGRGPPGCFTCSSAPPPRDGDKAVLLQYCTSYTVKSDLFQKAQGGAVRNILAFKCLHTGVTRQGVIDILIFKAPPRDTGGL